ncbi:MAG: flavohemoglobin expression-modulating QEGLA motif protein [Gammaproteobacteria bacterium]
MTQEQQIIYEISERIVTAQKPIRILDAVKWLPEIQEEFFAHQFKKLPAVDADYYRKLPLPFDPEEKIAEFYDIERDIHRKLGQFSGVSNIMLRMCREYRESVRMLRVRGSHEFSKISQGLYGSSTDAFYAGAPSLNDLAVLLSTTLSNIKSSSYLTELDEKKYSSQDAVDILRQRLKKYFIDPAEPVRVVLSDGIYADAAAGADVIKIRTDAIFSEREIRILEVHEGWVHVGTTLNGLNQPVCTFLSKGPPSSTIFQEGLAVIVEIFTFASHPTRIQRLTNRIASIHMAEEGADFIEVFNFLREQGFSDEDSYTQATRVFRGSTPVAGPFTKDLAYSKGFILIYNYIRLAIRNGLIDRIPLIFLGKTTIEDLHIYEDLIEEGTIVYPKYLPPHFRDLAGLTCWMSYSLFFNQLSIDKFSADYKSIL